MEEFSLDKLLQDRWGVRGFKSYEYPGTLSVSNKGLENTRSETQMGVGETLSAIWKKWDGKRCALMVSISLNKITQYNLIQKL